MRVIKRILKFNNHKNYLLNNEIILKLQQRSKIEADNAYTEEINKITLRSNDDKKLHHIHMVQILENYVKQSC